MVIDLFREALRNVRTHWLRVLLTGSGIMWGIALFVTLTATANGMRDHYAEKMAAIGRKVIYTFPGVIDKAQGGNRTARGVTLKIEDPPRLLQSPLIESSAGEVWSGPRVLKGGGHIKVVWTYGVEPSGSRIRNYVVGRGRFIDAEDVRQRRRVLVLGSKVEERLFGKRSALGQTVRLEGRPFRVIGVSQPKGEQLVNMGPRDDEQVLMPLTTAQALFTGSEVLSYMLHEPPTRPQGVSSIARVRALIGRHHYFDPGNEQALSFFNIADAVKLTEAIGFALQIFLTTCGLMTLIAGGVGVMNIMLVAVAERTRELGLRKAVGATNRDLFLQLLAETVAITIFAGVAGILLGAGIIGVLGLLRSTFKGNDVVVSSVTFSPELAIVAFAVLVAVGILAGIVPARRAAQLDPAVALRQE